MLLELEVESGGSHATVLAHAILRLSTANDSVIVRACRTYPLTSLRLNPCIVNASIGAVLVSVDNVFTSSP